MGTISSIGNALLPSNSNTVDVATLLQTAIAALQGPTTLLQTQQTNVETQTAVLQGIESDINNLTTAVSALTDTNGAINSFTAASSNPNLVTASADTTATAGTHSIVVSSLATTSSYYTNPVNTPTIGPGTFQIAVGSNSPVPITVDGTDNTLSGLASAINAKNAGVTASVVNDANGARLAIVSNTSGTSGNITISSNTTGLVFNQAATGANASLTVDGVPINSTSNTVSGVITGVTLNLTGAAPGTTVNLTLSPNTDQATTAINSFVSAWNTVVNDLNSQFSVSADLAGNTTAGPLEGDATLRNVQQQLLSAVTASVGGNNGLVNLASIGVNMNSDGTMNVDSSTLSNALSNNFGSVQNLLQGASGVATTLASTLNQITDPATGLITLDLQGLSQSNQSLTQQISDAQSQLTIQKQSLTTQYAQMEVTLQELPLLQNQITQELSSLSSS